jgi:hypothetical protein
MGLQARLMSQALRKLTANISKTNTCCIFINQLRDKIGVMFGNPETTTGGNALKFYSTMRLDVRKTTQLKDGEDATGNRTRVKVVKNKMAPPFRKAEFDILFGEGISKIGEIIDLGVEFGIIKKSGSWFSYGESKIGQGRDAVKQMLLDNPELAEEIEAKINNMPYVLESLVLQQKDNRLVALICPDYNEVDADGLTADQLAEQMEEARKQVNSELAAYEQIAIVKLYPNEFEKTPKKSIKRFLYTNMID